MSFGLLAYRELQVLQRRSCALITEAMSIFATDQALLVPPLPSNRAPTTSVDGLQLPVSSNPQVRFAKLQRCFKYSPVVSVHMYWPCPLPMSIFMSSLVISKSRRAARNVDCSLLFIVRAKNVMGASQALVLASADVC